MKGKDSNGLRLKWESVEIQLVLKVFRSSTVRQARNDIPSAKQNSELQKF